ncbi:MAG: hypothetical protein H7210_05585 [Pyrinomonadaceae bacterium]|nr:hypothetical protein [Phycisphaerales bacterium]
MPTYLHQGTEIEPTEAMKFQVIVAGSEITGKEDVILVFHTNEEFSKMAAQTRYGDQVQGTLQLIREKVLPERKRAALIQRMHRLALQHKEASFREFAELLDKDPKDEEVIRMAMLDRTPLTPNLFDPMLLYDRAIEREPPTTSPQDPRTAWLPIPSGFWPDLGWVGWNDRAQSVRFFGMNILCQHKWFGGRWAWLFGFNGLLNLSHLGFARITSSVISY